MVNHTRYSVYTYIYNHMITTHMCQQAAQAILKATVKWKEL